jgi:hypothetical protein
VKVIHVKSIIRIFWKVGRKFAIHQTWNVYLQLYTHAIVFIIACAQASLSSLFTCRWFKTVSQTHSFDSLYCDDVSSRWRCAIELSSPPIWSLSSLSSPLDCSCGAVRFLDGVLPLILPVLSELPFSRLGPFLSQSFMASSTSASVALRDLVFPRTASAKVTITNLNTLI